MHRIFSGIEGILADESEIYHEIYKLEADKTEAIIKKNGPLIQEITSLQEKLISRIETLESERGRFMGMFSAETGLRRLATLSEVASRADSATSARIMKCGSELKSMMLKLRDRQENNSRLLQDNMEFFGILISDLKNSSSLKSGYGSDGKENVRVVNPVLFNTKA